MGISIAKTLVIIFVVAASLFFIPAYAELNLDWTGHRLVIGDIRLFSPGKSDDYHFDETPFTGSVSAGQPITINALVKNQNHTGEHFDYITQVYDQNGVVQYINVRNGIAVPFGGQIPIDSGPPLILNDTGMCEVKIFAVIGLNRDSAQLASEPNGRSIVVQLPGPALER